mgnify:CR=1 FL=1|jgi:hypothetical protein
MPKGQVSTKKTSRPRSPRQSTLNFGKAVASRESRSVVSGCSKASQGS